jgi:hypothetical protein
LCINSSSSSFFLDFLGIRSRLRDSDVAISVDSSGRSYRLGVSLLGVGLRVSLLSRVRLLVVLLLLVVSVLLVRLLRSHNVCSGGSMVTLE